MKKNIFAWIIVAVVVVGVGVAAYQFSPYGQADKPELNAFAQCVASKGWTMYGAYWCSHCQKEKANYGSAFQYMNYVECTQQTQLCTDKKIESYPTWIGPDGSLHPGEQGLQGMAALSGCELPL